MKKYHEPNYRRIFKDILTQKYPEKLDTCNPILSKKELTALDVLQLNRLIFNTGYTDINQKHRSFNETAILQILEYQKIHNLNNSQLAIHFRLSRNTVTKWKKLFLS